MWCMSKFIDAAYRVLDSGHFDGTTLQFDALEAIEDDYFDLAEAHGREVYTDEDDDLAKDWE